MPRKSNIKIRQKKKINKSTTKTNVNRISSDNLQTSLLSSISTENNFEKSRPKCRLTASKTRTVKDTNKKQNNFEIPENVAIHFGNYYGLNGNLDKNKSQYEIKNPPRDARYSAYSHTKSQFTRQMVHKLENSVGKQCYAKEISALLEEIVEPPNFKIELPPAENYNPNRMTEPSFPLWYREPNKILFPGQGEYDHSKKHNEDMTSSTKYKIKNVLMNHSRFLKGRKENSENLEREINFDEVGRSRASENKTHGPVKLLEKASCPNSSSSSNSTSGWTTVTGKSVSGSTSPMESTSNSEDDNDDSASSSLSKTLTDSDNEYQGVNVPVVAH